MFRLKVSHGLHAGVLELPGNILSPDIGRSSKDSVGCPLTIRETVVTERGGLDWMDVSDLDCSNQGFYVF